MTTTTIETLRADAVLPDEPVPAETAADALRRRIAAPVDSEFSLRYQAADALRRAA